MLCQTPGLQGSSFLNITRLLVWLAMTDMLRLIHNCRHISMNICTIGINVDFTGSEDHKPLYIYTVKESLRSNWPLLQCKNLSWFSLASSPGNFQILSRSFTRFFSMAVR